MLMPIIVDLVDLHKEYFWLSIKEIAEEERFV